MADRLTTRQSMVSLTAVLPVRVILNVLPVGLLTVKVLAAMAPCPKAMMAMSAANILFVILVWGL